MLDGVERNVCSKKVFKCEEYWSQYLVPSLVPYTGVRIPEKMSGIIGGISGQNEMCTLTSGVLQICEANNGIIPR
jgi:hypothetical protein